MRCLVFMFMVLTMDMNKVSKSLHKQFLFTFWYNQIHRNMIALYLFPYRHYDNSIRSYQALKDKKFCNKWPNSFKTNNKLELNFSFKNQEHTQRDMY